MMYLSAVGGLALLFLGGEMLVRGAVTLARRLGLSMLVIGLTVVGFGTSAPEFLVSLEAALGGRTDIAVGNVVGSNIANILLILGLSALVYPIQCAPRAVSRDGVIMVAISILLVVLSHVGQITFGHGALMLAALVGYVGYSYWSEVRRNAGAGELYVQEAAEFEDVPLGPLQAVLLLAVGFGALVGGAKLLVEGAAAIARGAGVSEAVIGLTLVALGTSLPELATSLVAAYRRHTDVAVGNVLGSNIFNILGVLGLTATVTPIAIHPGIRDFDLWVMLGVAVIVLPFLIFGWRLNWLVGLIFAAGYGLYVLQLYDGVPGI